MTTRYKSGASAHAAARSLVVALRTWAVGSVVLVLFAALMAKEARSPGDACTRGMCPASYSGFTGSAPEGQ
jgi:ABC-type spermidine/putrescine transport system permease subunit II